MSAVCLGPGEEPVCSVSAQEKDGLSMLSEIFSSVEDVDFSREWRDVFGEDGSADGGTSEVNDAQPVEEEEEASFFFPSQLLDQNIHSLQSAMSGTSERRSVRSVTSSTSERRSVRSLTSGTSERRNIH